MVNPLFHGSRLARLWRERHGFSLERAATLIGVSIATLSRAENGIQQLNLRAALALDQTSGGFVPATSWLSTIKLDRRQLEHHLRGSRAGRRPDRRPDRRAA